MRHRRPTSAMRTLTGPTSVLLFAILALPLTAQVAPESRSSRSAAPVYDAAHEINITGTIQELVTKPTAGSPTGAHLVIAGPQGIVDAHLGHYLTQDTQKALRPGTPVQVVGAIETLHGKQVLMARQLVFAGRTVTVRSANGFLVRTKATRGDGSQSEVNSENELSGGAR